MRTERPCLENVAPERVRFCALLLRLRVMAAIRQGLWGILKGREFDFHVRGARFHGGIYLLESLGLESLT